MSVKPDLFDRFLRDLGGLYRARRMYPSGHEQVLRAAERVAERAKGVGGRIRIARIGADLVVEDRTIEDPPSSVLGLLDHLAREGREGIQIDPEVDGREFAEWIEHVVSGRLDEFIGATVRTGSLHLDAPRSATPRLTEAAAGYLSLTPGVREAMADLAGQKEGGLHRAKEIVKSIASQLAAGEELMNPIRGLKAHDGYTFTHALNVCVIASALARSLGLTKTQTDTVALAALCHDVGKEKIPSEILNKEGALDPREKEVMNEHPLHGAALLMGLSDPIDPLVPVVAYEHHLGADGSGYPRKPHISEVHPASLLVAVADTYDALRTVRSYQKPVSERQAFGVMLREERRGVLHRGFLGTFARLLEVLEPGAKVTLSTGQKGVVSGAPAPDPLRPVLRVESLGMLPLSEVPDLWIESVDEPEEATA